MFTIDMFTNSIEIRLRLAGTSLPGGQEPLKIVRTVMAQGTDEDPSAKPASDSSKFVLGTMGGEDLFLAREG